MKSLLRPVLRTGGFIAAALALPVLVGGGNLVLKWRTMDSPPPPFQAELPALLVHDADLPTAVVLLANGQTEATDFLAPYELLAASGLYNVYAVAPERRISPLFPGEIDVLPHLSFADYEVRVGGPPHVLVVPYMPDAAMGRDPILSDWITRQWGPSTLLVTICGGSMVVAQADLIDGRSATSHRNVLRLMRRDRPEVDWIDGIRYVDDGNLVSSAGITSGIDAMLYVLGREHGREVAERVARTVGYPHTRYLDDPTFEVPSASSIFGSALPAAYRPARELGLALLDGADEIEIAAVVDVYPRSLVMRLRTLGLDGTPITTRYGLHVVPRDRMGDEELPERILMVGDGHNDSALDELIAQVGAHRIERLSDPGRGFAYDLALADLGRSQSVAAARDAARGLEYPIEHLQLAGSRFPAGLLVLPASLAILGVGISIVLKRLWRSCMRGVFEAP